MIARSFSIPFPFGNRHGEPPVGLFFQFGNERTEDFRHERLYGVGSTLHFFVAHLNDFPGTPKSVMMLTPKVRMPQWWATMTSGTVLMPTASAPKVRYMRYSAGVS